MLYSRVIVIYRLCLRTFLIVSLLLPGSGKGQVSTGLRIMGIPQAFIRPELSQDDENIMGILPGTLWEIFSDRSDNTIYSDPEGSKVKVKAKFMDAFFVTNVKGDFLHIYTDPKHDDNGNLSPSAIDEGWIKKSSALLWRACLSDKQNKKFRHMTAMTLGQTNLFGLGGTGTNGKDGITIYHDPGLKNKTNRKTIKKEIYFIYKKSGNAFLIGKERRIPDNADPNDYLLGWIPEDYSYILDTRVWITPFSNSNPEINKIDTILTPLLFIDKEHAKNFKKTAFVDPKYVLWQKSKEEKDTGWCCYPLMDEIDGVFRVRIIEDEFKTGFGCEQVTGMKTILFKKVVLINNSDLNSVVSNFRDVIELTGVSNDRSDFKKTLVQLFKKTHEDLQIDLIYTLPIKEVLENLFWSINSKEAWLDLSCRDIDNMNIIQDADIQNLIQSIIRSDKVLNRIVNINYYEDKVMTFLSNNTRYFWIDLDLFP